MSGVRHKIKILVTYFGYTCPAVNQTYKCKTHCPKYSSLKLRYVLVPLVSSEPFWLTRRLELALSFCFGHHGPGEV